MQAIHLPAAMAHAMRIDSDYEQHVLGNDMPRGLPRLAAYLREVNRARRARHAKRRGARRK